MGGYNRAYRAYMADRARYTRGRLFGVPWLLIALAHRATGPPGHRATWLLGFWAAYL